MYLASTGRIFPALLQEGLSMDWIEKLFGISPDGGDGTAETAIVLAFAIVLAAVIGARVPAIRDALRKRLLGSGTRQR
jgi:hypothetical protein